MWEGGGRGSTFAIPQQALDQQRKIDVADNLNIFYNSDLHNRAAQKARRCSLDCTVSQLCLKVVKIKFIDIQFNAMTSKLYWRKNSYLIQFCIIHPLIYNPVPYSSNLLKWEKALNSSKVLSIFVSLVYYWLIKV